MRIGEGADTHFAHILNWCNQRDRIGVTQKISISMIFRLITDKQASKYSSIQQQQITRLEEKRRKKNTQHTHTYACKTTMSHSKIEMMKKGKAENVLKWFW